MTAAETKKVFEAFKKGHGKPFPAELTEKVVNWGRKAKFRKDANFRFAMKGEIKLKMNKGKVMVT